MRQTTRAGQRARVIIAVAMAALLPLAVFGLQLSERAGADEANRARFPVPTYPAEFLKLCSSPDASAQAQCDGYFEAVVQRLHALSACRSTSAEAQAFCAGSREARKTLRAILDACKDCPPAVLRERIAKLKTCKPSATVGQLYCDGYNAELLLMVDDFQDPLTVSPRSFGRQLAEGSFGMAMFGSKYNAFAPCVSHATKVEDVRALALDFIRKYPGPPEGADERLDTLETVWRAIYIRLCPGPMILAKAAEPTSPPLEFCTHVSFYDGDYRTQNWCDKPVAFTISTVNGVAEAVLAPGQFFAAGLKPKQEKGMLFTTCPAGFATSMPLGSGMKPEHREPIRRGEYECVRK